MPSLEALQQHLVERPWRAGLYAFGALTLATLALLAAEPCCGRKVFRCAT